MVILVSTSSRAKECGAAIEHTTHQRTQIAASLARAVEFPQAHDYDALVLDESFHPTEIGAVNRLLNHAGMAMPVYVNLAHGSERWHVRCKPGYFDLSAKNWLPCGLWSTFYAASCVDS